MSTSEDSSYGATHWQAVRRLFHQARELPQLQRAEFLDRECRDEEELRRAVEKMLAADACSEGFLEPPAPLLLRELEMGRQVGPFRVVERIGAGNMGEVYRAERETPFRQSVALKIIDGAKFDDEMVWRFQHERQILALLDHPNIARIIDGGTLDDERPWFALEFVEGERIDRYCNRHKLSIRQRIELFRKVCAAVSEAHGLAVVHRDIKPANILVSADGEPKLLDFGIAKTVEEELVATDAPTRYAMASDENSDSGLDSSPLTPLYSSPEQAAQILNPDAEEHPPIGVRSDVYALGVVLYELLTGHPPYSETTPWPVLLRAVAEEVPRPPSEVVTTERRLGGRRPKTLTPMSVATERCLGPRSLRRELAGDLDAVVSRALEKRSRDRYESVAMLDADLRAFLKGYPVTPRSSSKLYRTGRFLRRNLLPVVAGSAAVLILLIYFAMDWRSRQQLLDSRELFYDLTQLHIKKLSDDEEFTRQLRKAVANYGDRYWLAQLLSQRGQDLEDRGYLRGALALYQENLEMRSRLLGPEHAYLSSSYNNLAGVQMRLGLFEDAESNYYRDLAIREEYYGSDSVRVSRTLNNLAALYQHWGGDRLPEARTLLERSLGIRRLELRRSESLGEDVEESALQVLATRNNLATQSLLEGRYAEAEAVFREVLDGLSALPDSESAARRRAGVQRNFSLAQLGLGNIEAAEANAREALLVYRQDYLHWRIADAESVLGAALAAQGRLEEAWFFLDRSVEDLRTSQTEKSRHVREAEERRAHWLAE